MATQRLVLAKIVGESGRIVADRCREWQRRQQASPEDPQLRAEIGRFAETLDTHRYELPVVSSVEWLDRWSMGDDFSTPLTTRGGVALISAGRFTDVYCTDRPAGLLTLPVDGWQFDELRWLASRLREAATAWEKLVGDATLILHRQVLGASVSDEEVTAAMSSVPAWLTEV